MQKIWGKLYHFELWNDPDAVLKRYLQQKDALHAECIFCPNATSVTVKDIANAFLNAKKDKLDNGKQSPRTWLSYKENADAPVKHLGKIRLVIDLRPSDFSALRKKMVERQGVYALARFVQTVPSTSTPTRLSRSTVSWSSTWISLASAKRRCACIAPSKDQSSSRRTKSAGSSTPPVRP